VVALFHRPRLNPGQRVVLDLSVTHDPARNETVDVVTAIDPKAGGRLRLRGRHQAL